MAKKVNKDNQDYHVQQANNEEVFKNMVRTLRPDLYVLLDILEKTQVSPMILYKTVRSLYNIAIGTQYGSVTLIIEKGRVRFIKGEEMDKLEEPIVLEP